MPAKKSLEYWVAEVKKTHGERYQCLELLPKKSAQDKARLLALCEVHGEFEAAALALANGKHCPKCTLQATTMAKRKPLEAWVAEFQAVHGDRFEYLRLTYGTATTIVYSCPDHGEISQTAHSHLSGSGCSACSAASPSKRRLSYEQWLKRFTGTHGDKYSYTDVVYDEAKALVHYLCSVHGEQKQKAQDHFLGKGCSSCAREYVGNLKRIPESVWLDRFKSSYGDKYLYLDVIATDRKSVVSYVCDIHGDVTQSSYDHLYRGCPDCNKANRVSKRISLEEWVSRYKAVHGDKYNYVDIVYGQNGSIIYHCPSHGEQMQVLNDHLRLGCGACRPHGGMGNKHTKEIADYVNSLGLSVIEEHSFPGSRKRWDVLVPEAKVAIEFDGIYFHSEKFKSDPAAMRVKADEASARGFRQLNIWEDEWYDKRDIVKKLIASAIGRSTDSTVYARKAQVCMLDNAEAAKFLDANHIQGFAAGSHYVGLKHGEVVVACMVYSYKAAGRSTVRVEDCIDIQRYATSCRVVGGFQKLLKHALLDEKIRTVISYSDPRLFSGGMYEKAGFVASPEGSPDYCYVKGAKRISKRARQKSWFQGREGILYDPTLTEYELALLNGYQRLWFRGKVKWTLTR